MSQKIVINACFGGYSLSAAAVEALAKRKGIDRLYWFTTHSPNYTTYVPTERPDDEFTKVAFTDAEATVEFEADEIARDDPDLVAMVEELGSQASVFVSDLRVVEIPDGVKWEIEEYDGNETVAEIHRTWR